MNIQPYRKSTKYSSSHYEESKSYKGLTLDPLVTKKPVKRLQDSPRPSLSFPKAIPKIGSYKSSLQQARWSSSVNVTLPELAMQYKKHSHQPIIQVMGELSDTELLQASLGQISKNYQDLFRPTMTESTTLTQTLADIKEYTQLHTQQQELSRSLPSSLSPLKYNHPSTIPSKINDIVLQKDPPVYTTEHKEASIHSLEQHALLPKFDENETKDWICLVADQTISTIEPPVLKIPMAMAYLSPTLKHIHSCSGPFLEGVTGRIKLSGCQQEALQEIIRYLHHKYTETKSKFVIQNKTVLIDVVDTALYLELVELVDIASDLIASRYDGRCWYGILVLDVKYLRKLPRALIKSIMKKMTIPSLFLFEHSMHQLVLWQEKQDQSQLMYATAQTPFHRFDMMDTQPYWTWLYLKMLKRLIETDPHSHYSKLGFSTDPRQSCLQYFFREYYRSQAHSDMTRKLFKILHHTPFTIITTLCLHASSNCLSSNTFLLQVFEHLEPHLSTMKLILDSDQVHESVWRMLYSVKDRIRLQLMLVLSFSAHHQDISPEFTGLIQSIPRLISPPLKLSSINDATFESGETMKWQIFPSSISYPHQGGSLSLRCFDSSPGISLQHAVQVLSMIPMTFIHHLDCHQFHPLASFHQHRLGQVFSNFHHLSSLQLSGCKVCPRAMTHLLKSIKGFRSLMHLNLSNNIQSETISQSEWLELGSIFQDILASPECPIQVLDISRNAFSASALQKIVMGIEKNTSIVDLNVSDIDLNGTLLLLSESLVKRAGILYKLILRNVNVLPRVLRESLAHIVPTKTWKTLKQLDLSQNAMDESMGMLLQESMLNNNLGQLILNGNTRNAMRLGNVGCHHLLMGIISHNHLTRLSLCHQDFNDDHLVLLSSLLSSTHLTHVNLSHNLLSDQGLYAMSASLSSVTLHQHVLLDVSHNPAISQSIQQEFMQWSRQWHVYIISCS